MARETASRTKSWVFTLANPHPAEYWNILPHGVKFITWQLEQGGNTGLPHLQGVVQFVTNITLDQAKRRLNSNTIHMEPMRGTWDQAIAYANKEDTRVDGPWTLGERPAQGKRKDLDTIRDKIKEGVSMLDIAEDHFGDFCRYGKAFNNYANMLKGERQMTDPLTVVVITGDPGLGKSFYANTTLIEWGLEQGYVGVYRKTPDTKWWDHYEGQQIILFDDFNGSWFPWTSLLQILDVYPTKVEPKGLAAVPLQSRLMIMTSNREPETWYTDARCPSAALLRRITHRIRFDAPRHATYVKGSPLEPGLHRPPPAEADQESDDLEPQESGSVEPQLPGPSTQVASSNDQARTPPRRRTSSSSHQPQQSRPRGPMKSTTGILSRPPLKKTRKTTGTRPAKQIPRPKLLDQPPYSPPPLPDYDSDPDFSDSSD